MCSRPSDHGTFIDVVFAIATNGFHRAFLQYIRVRQNVSFFTRISPYQGVLLSINIRHFFLFSNTY